MYLQVSESIAGQGLIDTCVVCGKDLFYLQKDFNRRLGCAILVVGAITSIFTYGLSLLVAAARGLVSVLSTSRSHRLLFLQQHLSWLCAQSSAQGLRLEYWRAGRRKHPRRAIDGSPLETRRVEKDPQAGRK